MENLELVILCVTSPAHLRVSVSDIVVWLLSRLLLLLLRLFLLALLLLRPPPPLLLLLLLILLPHPETTLCCWQDINSELQSSFFSCPFNFRDDLLIWMYSVHQNARRVKNDRYQFDMTTLCANFPCKDTFQSNDRRKHYFTWETNENVKTSFLCAMCGSCEDCERV